MEIHPSAKLCCRYAFGIHSREGTCGCDHVIVPPGYSRKRNQAAERRPTRFMFSMLTTTPGGLAAIDLLQYFVHEEDHSNAQPLQHEQDEQELHHRDDDPLEELEGGIKMEDEAALPEDLAFN